MNHSESNLNKLFNQCYIWVPDLGNLLSKELFWPLLLLLRWPGLSRWLSLMVQPQSLHSGIALFRRFLCRVFGLLLLSPTWPQSPAHWGPTALLVPLRHTAEGHLHLLAFCRAVVLTCRGSACAQTLQAEHDLSAQPHGPEHKKENIGKEHWREDTAVKINAETFHKQRWPFEVSGQG